MEYTSRLGDKPSEAHVNYQCPCGCTAGLIYDRESGSTELGQCCCGRLLWVGDKAGQVVELLYEDGVNYKLDIGSVTLPWGDTLPAALAVPASALEDADATGTDIGTLVKEQLEEMVSDVICGMPVRPDAAAGTSEFRGVTFYFCSESCKTRFDGAPETFATGGGR